MPNTDQSWINLRSLTRRNLGDGMIDVELTDAQVDDSIAQALREFRTRASSATKEGWMFLRLFEDQRIYRLPSYVEDVVDVQRVNEAFFTSFENTQFANFLYNHLRNGHPFDLLTYHLERSFLETLQILAASEISFRFHQGLDGSQLGQGLALSSLEAAQVPSTRPLGSKMIDTEGSDNAIGLDTPNKEMEFENQERLEGPVLEILKRPRSNDNDELVVINLEYSRTDAELIQDKETTRFLEKWALAESKIKLGNAYRKFGSIPGPGGGLTLPGNELVAEGKEEKKDLEQDLLDFLYGNEPHAFQGPV